MEQIIELIEMLRDGFLPVPKNKLGKRVINLYDYLKEEDRPTEDEAAEKVGVVPGSSDFRKVKHHLKLALINGVVMLDPKPKVDPASRIEVNHEVWNYISAGQVGLGPIKDFIASDIPKKVLELAKTFDLQEPSLAAYLLLVSSPVSTSLKKRDFLELCQQAEVELKYDYKLQVGHRHFAHSTFLNIKRASDAKKIAHLKRAVTEINQIDAVERLRTWQTSLQLKLKLFFAQKEYDNVIDLVKKALPKFDAKDPAQKQMLKVLQNNLLRAYLFACRYDEGVEYGKQLLLEDGIRKLTLYSTQEITMVLALRAGDYESAYNIYSEVIAEGEIKVLNDNFRETFLIIEAYIQIIIRLGLIQVDHVEWGNSKLRIGRFVNSMSFSSKEKKRRNIHVIIIKLVNYSINATDRDFNMADSVRKYVQRHLTDLKTIRARNFILALVSFSENGFNLNYAQNEREKYFTVLNKYPTGKNNQHPYGELVVFESLWRHIVEYTKR